MTILFDRRGNRLDDPDVRRVPQITAADGVDTTFFGFDIDGNGFPNFFGTSTAAPDAAAVVALVLQAAGGPGSIEPDDLYERLQHTATRMPLSANRTLSVAFAGPLGAAANGDFPRETNYWQLGVTPFVRDTINSVTINLTAANTLFSNPASATTGFHIGKVHGISPTDVTVSRSADRTSLTLEFKPGTFGAGDFITFANFAFPTLLPVQFEVDADRAQGGQVTVNFSSGTTKTGTFRVEPAKRVNAFTGGGHSGGHASSGHASGGHASSGHASAGPHSVASQPHAGSASAGPSPAHGHSGDGHATVGIAVPRTTIPSPYPGALPRSYLVTRWTYPPILYSPYIGVAAGGVYATGFWPGYGYSSYGYPMSPVAPGDTPPPVRGDAAADSGNLRLDVRPVSAQAFVDGYFVGSVEDVLNTLAGLQLTAGPHRLELRAAGYETLTVDVLIQPGRAITFRADLKPQQ